MWRAERSGGPLGEGIDDLEEDNSNVGGERGRLSGSASGGGSRSRLDLASPVFSPRDGGATPGAEAGEDEEGEQEEGPDFLYDEDEGELEDEAGMEGEGYVNESEMRRLVLGRVGGWVDWAVGWAVDFRGEDVDGQGVEERDGDEGAEDQEGGNAAEEAGKGRKGGGVRWEGGEGDGEEGVVGRGGLDVRELDRRLVGAASSSAKTAAADGRGTAAAEGTGAERVEEGKVGDEKAEGRAEDAAQGGWVRDARWLLRVAGGGGV